MAALGVGALGAGLGTAMGYGIRRGIPFLRSLPGRFTRYAQRAGAKANQRAAAARLAAMNRTFSPRFAKNQALKLARITYPCVLKMPILSCPKYGPSGSQSNQYTVTSRICPFGRKPALSGVGVSVNTLFENDTRFRTLCTLYSEFHIVSVTFNVQVISPAGDVFKSDNAASSMVNDITIFGNVIRNAPYTMDYTTLQDTDYLSVPGIIWARPKTSVSYPVLKVTVREKTLEEKMQWLPTSNNGASQLNWVADDPAIKWFPALDVSFSTSRGWGATNFIYYAVVVRAIVKFRSGKLPTATAAGTTKEIIARAQSRAKVEQSIPPGTDVQDVSRTVMGYETAAPVVNDK